MSDRNGSSFEDELGRLMRQEVAHQLAGHERGHGAGRALAAQLGRRRRTVRSAAVVTFAAAVTAGAVMVATLGGGTPPSKPSHRFTSTSTTTPDSGTSSSYLNGVSCATPAACVAAGTFSVDISTSSSGVSRGFAEIWTGSAWRASTAAAGPGGDMTAFDAVSCPAPSVCVAVGQAGTSPSGGGFGQDAVPLAELWGNGHWALMDLPTVPQGSLDGVSCPSVDECVAVGSVATAVGPPSGSVPLAELWSDGSWRRMTLPRFASGTLAAVSCPAANTCFAVGDQVVTVASGHRGEVPLVLRWDGAGWATAQQPALWDSFPPAGFDGYPDSGYTLAGVSCSSPAACVAVGAFHLASAPETSVPLVELWTGASWSVDRYPGGVNAGSAPPADLVDNPSLAGVACVNGAPCLAVGWVNNYCDHPGTEASCTLEAARTESSWEVDPVRVDNAYLNAITCASRTACVAVGEYGGTLLPLVMRWNGSAWLTSPAPPGG